jgi:hypothetical protein
VNYYTTISNGFDASLQHNIDLVYVFAESENEAIGVATNTFFESHPGGKVNSVAAYRQRADTLLRAYCRTAEIGEDSSILLAGETGRGTVQWCGGGDRAAVVAVVEQSGAVGLAEALRSHKTKPFSAMGPAIVKMFEMGVGLFGRNSSDPTLPMQERPNGETKSRTAIDHRLN